MASDVCLLRGNSSSVSSWYGPALSEPCSSAAGSPHWHILLTGTTDQAYPVQRALEDDALTAEAEADVWAITSGSWVPRCWHVEPGTAAHDYLAGDASRRSP